MIGCKVSVIVPVYNVQEYLPKCIESLLNQTLKEIQLILVNDASTDDSFEIMRAYKERYPDRITIVNLLVNQRQGGARNEGIKVAQGDWIGFVDSDDYVEETTFEKLYSLAVQTNADNVICGHNIVDTEGGILSSVTLSEKTMQLHNCDLTNADRDYLIGAYLGGGVWNRLWKKQIILNSEVVFPVGKRYEDNYFMTCTIPYLTKIAFVRECLYNYRQTPGSTVLARNSTHHLDKIEMEERIQDVFIEKGMYEQYKTGLEYLCIRRYFFNFYYLYTSRFDKIDWSIIYKVKKSLKVRFPNWKKNIYLKQDDLKKEILRTYRFPRLKYQIEKIGKKIKKIIRR